MHDIIYDISEKYRFVSTTNEPTSPTHDQLKSKNKKNRTIILLKRTVVRLYCEFKVRSKEEK